MNEQKMEWCLFAKWGGQRSEEAARKEIRTLLCRKGPNQLFCGLQRRAERKGDKRVPYDTFITVCALFCRGQNSYKKIVKAISHYNRVGPMLFTGFRIFLRGGRRGTKFQVKYNDDETPNYYEWLSYWSGMGRHNAYEELFMVARVLKELDENQFWQLAKADSSDFLLMNWSNIFWSTLPEEKARELFSAAESVRRQALGFWWLTLALRRDAEGEARAEALLSSWRELPETLLTPHLYEFLLGAPECPKAFSAYLLEPSRAELLRQELAREGLLRTPREAVRAAALIRELPSKRRQRPYWKLLFSQLEAILEPGILGNDARQLEWDAELISIFPEEYQRKLIGKLRTRRAALHTEMLDYIIRPRIHQREAAQKAAIERLISSSSV